MAKKQLNNNGANGAGEQLSRVTRKQAEQRKGFVKRFAGTKAGKVVIAGAVAFTVLGGGYAGASSLLTMFDHLNANEVDGKLATVTERMGDLMENYNLLRSDRDAKLSKVKSLETQIADLNAQIADIQASAISKEDYDAKVQEVKTLQSQITALKAERDALLTDTQTLQAEVNEANAQVQQTEATLDQTLAEYEEFVDGQTRYYTSGNRDKKEKQYYDEDPTTADLEHNGKGLGY